MVTVERMQVGAIPVLHVVNETDKEAQLPLVLFIHGFTSAKEHNLHFAFALAEQGFRVVLPDALHHGERDDLLSEEKLTMKFWDIVLNEIAELEEIVTYFKDCKMVDEERIGLAGISMGGIVTCGALTKFPWIKTAVCLMGTPHYKLFITHQLEQLQVAGKTHGMADKEVQQYIETICEYDLTLQHDVLNGRPLLFWHGEQDTVVPFQPTYSFYESLLPQYESAPETLQFIRDPYVGHKVSREAYLATIDWFATFL